MASAARLTSDPADAVAGLRAGWLAALPTETVYGLGADAADPAAVARVFAVKGRPADHPLIVHLASVDQLDQFARSPRGYARKLAETFWPGPLTLLLGRSSRVGDWITGGRETVGLRVPDHACTLTVLHDFGGGVAAPSANRFGRVSPTRAEHVVSELGDLLVAGDVVLDGGQSVVGLESTIVDCTLEMPAILRPGAVTSAAIAEVVGVLPQVGRLGVQAPGTLAAHYEPEARVRIVSEDEVAGFATGSTTRVGLLAMEQVDTPPGLIRLAAPADVEDFARSLYAAFREADALMATDVLVVPPRGEGLATAIRDRLRRAAAR